MNYKTTYILFGVLIAILLAVTLSMWFAPVKEETGKYVLPSANGKTAEVTPDAVAKVQIDRARPEQETLVFERDPDTKTWKITGPRALRANTSSVEDLVRELLTAEVDSKADVPADLKAAELDPPAETITLTTKDGKELKVNVGAESPLASSAVVYLSSSDKPTQAMPVQKSRVEKALKGLNFFRNAYVLASAPSDYSFVKLSLDKVDKKDAPKGSLVLIKKDEGLWEYKNPEGYDGSAAAGDVGALLEPGKPPSGVDALVSELSKLQVESSDASSDYVEDAPKDLDKYGLDPAKADVLTIEIERTESAKGSTGEPKKTPMKLTVALGKKVEDKTDKPAEKDKPADKDKAPAKYYAAVQDGQSPPSVIKIPVTVPDAAALLFKDPTVLCNKSLVALGGFKKPVAVDVVNAGGKLEFRREKGEDPWRLFRDGQEAAVDTTAVDALVNQLVQGGQVRSFLDPKTTDPKKVGLDPPAATVCVWVDGVKKEEEKKDEKKDDSKDEKKDDKTPEKKPEPKPKLVLEADKVDKPAARLTFGAVEDKQVVVRREANHKDWNESAFVKAPDLLLDQAKAGPLAYYDKKLPKFTEGFSLADPSLGVVKLELDHDGVHYVLTRADVKAETPWKFEEPKDWAVRKVDAVKLQGVLSGLNNLRATTLVAEAPKDEDLDKVYGLKSPAAKAVVTKEDKTSYTYEFGKAAADGGIYARQGQRPMVFEVNKFDLDNVKTDLRDLGVFAFDPAKVKTLKMTGWQKKTGGEVLTRELERKDDKTWTVKTPPNLPMNFDKVNKFVEELSKLRADRFVSADAMIKGEYEKEAPKSAFTVEIKVDGVDAPFVVKAVDLTADQTLPEGDRQVYASTPQYAGDLFQVRRTLFTAPAGKPMEIGPMDEAGYFSP